MQQTGTETIVVTGASSGIGRELAIQLAAPGREIWLIGRDSGRLGEVSGKVRTKGAIPHVVQLELADLDGVARFLNENFPAEKPAAAIYLAAAVTLFGEVKDTLPEDWERIYRINLLSPVQWMHHFYSNMVSARSGKIVLISSLAAYAGYPTATAYATMKAGLLGLYRSMRHEGEAYGVGFHIASPGYVDTGIYKSAVFRGTSYERTMSQIKSMGFRILSAEETAKVILSSVRRGESEFALPAYASIMKWIARRLPMLIELIHAKIMKRFRQPS